jgi:hypothetical protein
LTQHKHRRLATPGPRRAATSEQKHAANKAGLKPIVRSASHAGGLAPPRLC